MALLTLNLNFKSQQIVSSVGPADAKVKLCKVNYVVKEGKPTTNVTCYDNKKLIKECILENDKSLNN